MQKEINVAVILEAVKQAGDIFLKEFKQNTIPQNREQLGVKFNAIEERCITLLKNSLAADFPETPWLGEEFDLIEQQKPIDLPEYWLCDSMDGAIQYLQHLPGWTINLVLVRDGRPYFAVIYDALQQEMFWAQEGKGAYLNNTPIKPNDKTDFSLMLAVFNHAPNSTKTEGLNHRTGVLVTELLDTFGAVRNYGPHGLMLASLATGRIDVFYQEGLDTYNWLPGILIAKEAGADVLAADGSEWTWGADSLLVSIPGVAERFLKAKNI